VVLGHVSGGVLGDQKVKAKKAAVERSERVGHGALRLTINVNKAATTDTLLAGIAIKSRHSISDS
jgi:hypothetical protein